jgi:hypothetical protein
MESAYDLVIFDGFLPSTFPVTSSLFIAPPQGHVGALHFGTNLPAGTVEPSSGTVGTPGSLLKYVDLSDVHIALTRSLPLPGWLQPLALSGGHTVIAAGEQGTTRVAVVDFDLQHSDWPLRISFPIMLQNLFHYLAPGLTLGATTITVGQPVTFFPPPHTRELEVIKPGGAIVYLQPPFPPFTDTARAGLYTVKTVSGARGARAGAGGLSEPFAVNFFPARPAAASGPATVHLGRVQAGKTLTASIPVSVVWLFELAALAVLATEWWIAFRGGTPGRRHSA